MTATLARLHRDVLLCSSSSAPLKAEQSANAGYTAEATARHLLGLLGAGALVDVLRSSLAAQLLTSDDVPCDGAADRVRAYVSSVPLEDAASAASAVIAVGAAALSLFTHANWTGSAGASLRELDGWSHGGARHEGALAALHVDGELAYNLVDVPALLCAARALLVLPLDALAAAAPRAGFACHWWAARCMMVHQRCLGSSTPSLERDAARAMRHAIDAIDAFAQPAAAPAATESGAAPAVADATDAPITPPPAAVTAASELSGRYVMVVGLEGRPELNGQRGIVGAYDAAKGRYARGRSPSAHRHISPPCEGTRCGRGRSR